MFAKKSCGIEPQKVAGLVEGIENGFEMENTCSRNPSERLMMDCETEGTGKDVRTPLTNPIGCNVKWEGKDPHWMPAEACDLVYDKEDRRL